MVGLSLLSSVLAATGDLDVGPSVMPFVGNSGATGKNSVTKMDGYASIACYAYNGITCGILVRTRPGGEYHGDLPFEDEPDDSTVMSAPYAGSTPVGHPEASITVSTDASAEMPEVRAFNQRDAMVCYKTSEHIACRGLKMWGMHLSASPERILPPTVGGGVLQLSVTTFDKRGAPSRWDMLGLGRAMVCYTIFTASQRKLECMTAMLVFPKILGTAREVNGNVPGRIFPNPGPPTVIKATPNGPLGIYPGPRMYEGRGLDAFDHMHAIICYTMPISYSPRGGGIAFWYHGSGYCSTLSLDAQMGGATVTVSPETSIAAGWLSEVAVTTFRAKSGDPTRALVCYTKCADPSPQVFRGIGYNTGLYCSVAQRRGTGLTFLNSERVASGANIGAASAGVSTEATVAMTVAYNAQTNTPGVYVKGTTITELNEYNALVCYTAGYTVASRIPICPYPSSGCAGGGNGLLIPEHNGVPVCKMLYVSGYGSSTYNSPTHNGVADAGAPANVGSVQSVSVGPAFTVNAAAGSFASVAALKSHYAVYCYSKLAAGAGNTNTGACHLISTSVALRTWHFAAPVDCVDMFNCPSGPGTSWPTGRMLSLTQKFKALLAGKATAVMSAMTNATRAAVEEGEKLTKM